MSDRILNDRSVVRLVQIALAEDVGPGDLTSESLVDPEALGRAFIVAKQRGVLAGTSVAGVVFSEVDRAITCEWQAAEGAIVESGERLAVVHGSLRSILTAERTALNFLQRMSGVASLTRQYVDAVRGHGAIILDTRKTIPGWRVLDKYAVTVGGGVNHRIGLFDAIMIKDNHVDAHGSIAGAILAATRYLKEREMEDVPVIVETRDLTEVSEAVSCGGVNRILFDNFPTDRLRQAVTLVGDRCATEASGGISLATVAAVAETGVDYISIGALTHSATAMDISLDLQT